MRNETPQSGSNERDELARLLPAPPERDLPSGRLRQLQELVVNHIQDQGTTTPPKHRLPRRRFAVATGALAAVAAAAVVLTVAANGGDTGPPDRDSDTTATESETSRTFELAASFAASQPWTAPRPDQWIYIKTHNVTVGAMEKAKGQKENVDREYWLRADGSKKGEFNDTTNRFETWEEEHEYPELLTLPVEPNALLAELRRRIEETPSPADQEAEGVPAPPLAEGSGPEKTDEEWNAELFERISRILDTNVLPPDLTAGLWRAAGMIPGVTVAEEKVVVDGRETIAVGRIQEGWRFEQLLVDPETYEFVGYRVVAVEDYTYPIDEDRYPPGQEPETVTVKQGEPQWETTRLAAGIVDDAFDRV